MALTIVAPLQAAGEYGGNTTGNPAQPRERSLKRRKKQLLVLNGRLKGADTDFALVSGVRSGDENAMARLYDKYSSIVYSVALRVLGDTGVAEDVLQEVFMQLWRNPGVFDSSRGNLAAWFR